LRRHGARHARVGGGLSRGGIGEAGIGGGPSREVGFGDLSYFNRSFRRRFERTPREARAEAIRAWAEEDQRGDGGSELVARRR
jgi:hypothetical protein